ncbi:hypothetical protein PRUPE_6G288200 [Prunus persica]|uniref:Uncharacterized protein n=1 Tax=Prunus persica TaxID=3760 RepID=A0A251NYN9_PRUPE|nr:hypothetical protein PRUPE_6G288200 [Prunus persica]
MASKWAILSVRPNLVFGHTAPQTSTLLFPSSNFLQSAPSGPSVAPIFLWLAERIFPRAVDLFTLNAAEIRKPFPPFFYINKGARFFHTGFSGITRKKDTDEEEEEPNFVLDCICSRRYISF